MRKPFAVILVPAAALLLIVAGQFTARAQAPDAPEGKSIWDAVYTSAQADTGKAVYQEQCATCHNADLSGGRGPALRGDALFKHWENLGSLYKKMKTTMPRNTPASLKDEAYLEIVAYILQANELPAGAQPLAADAVEKIQVFPKGGPEAPLFTLVDVVGCLTQTSENSWSLMNSSAPMKTGSPLASEGADLQHVQATPLGTQTFQLVDVFKSPEALKGHKVEAKGFLFKLSPANDLSLASLQTVAPTCN